MQKEFGKDAIKKCLLACLLAAMFPCMAAFGLGWAQGDAGAAAEAAEEGAEPATASTAQGTGIATATQADAEGGANSIMERAELMARLKHLDDYGKEKEPNPDYRKKGYVYTEEMYLKLTGKTELPEDWLEEMNPLMGELIEEEQEYSETPETDDGAKEDRWAPANELDSSLYAMAVSSTEPLSAAGAAVRFSMTRLGYPYSQPRRDTGIAYDCSSLVYWAYREAGVDIDPVNCHTAANIAEYLEGAGLGVDGGSLLPGDLIFYSYKRNGRYKNISHVAMVIDGGLQIHASSSCGKVVTRGIDLEKAVAVARPTAGDAKEGSYGADTAEPRQQGDAGRAEDGASECEGGGAGSGEEPAPEGQEGSLPDIVLMQDIGTAQEAEYGPGLDDPIPEAGGHGPGGPPLKTEAEESAPEADIPANP